MLTAFAIYDILDVWHGSEHDHELVNNVLAINCNKDFYTKELYTLLV